MPRITKEMKIEEYCKNLRTGLDLQMPDYSFDPWKNVQIYDGGMFHCNDDDTPFALYRFYDEVSPACARRLGSCRIKRLMNDYLAGVSFKSYAQSKEIWKRINGETVEPPNVYATCFKLLPVKREIFRTIDINEDGMFEIELTPRRSELFCLPEEDFPKKSGSVTFPLRIRLSGGMPADPVKFECSDAKRSKCVSFVCGGEEYQFFTGSSYEIPTVTIQKWYVRKDEEGVYLDILVQMEFHGFYLME